MEIACDKCGVYKDKVFMTKYTDGKNYCLGCSMQRDSEICSVPCDACGIMKESFFMHQFKDNKKYCGSCYSEKEKKETNENLPSQANNCVHCGINPIAYDNKCCACYCRVKETEFWEENRICDICGQERDIIGNFAFCKNCSENPQTPISKCSKCKENIGVDGHCKKCSVEKAQNNQPSHCGSYMSKDNRCNECYMCKVTRHVTDIIDEEEKKKKLDMDIKANMVRIWVESHREHNYPECPCCQVKIGSEAAQISPEFNDEGDIGQEMKKEKYRHIRDCSSATNEQKNDAIRRLESGNFEEEVQKPTSDQSKHKGKIEENPNPVIAVWIIFGVLIIGGIIWWRSRKKKTIISNRPTSNKFRLFKPRVNNDEKVFEESEKSDEMSFEENQTSQNNTVQKTSVRNDFKLNVKDQPRFFSKNGGKKTTTFFTRKNKGKPTSNNPPYFTCPKCDLIFKNNMRNSGGSCKNCN